MLALSGGVDSSVAAFLLQQQGYHVIAAVFEFSQSHKKTTAAAADAAAALGLELHIKKEHDRFFKTVITPFSESYLRGETPNPCVICNPLLKFQLLCELADSLGIAQIATGHYANVATQGDRHFITKACSLERDQSYMLYRLTQHQLSRLLLPLGALAKPEVRRIAEEEQLPAAKLPDSQELCFLPDGERYPAYIERWFGASKKGNFIAPDGAVIGPHKGIVHYTVGQRKHLGVSLGEPVFIRAIDALGGDIYLARAAETGRLEITLSECVYQAVAAPSGPMAITAKIRSQSKGVSAELVPAAEDRATVRFFEPQPFPAKGQSCVFYLEDRLLGGGFIC